MIQERTIAQVVRTYRDQLTNSVYETLNGRVDAMGMGRAHRDMIWRLGPDAYMEGLREGGVPAEELDAADRKAITDWLNSQMAHVNKFASDTVAARGDDGKRKQILARLDMWIESMRTIGNQGLMSAKKNKMGTWRLGGTIEHCTTCSGLHKKRHRLSWYTSRGLIPRQPGSQTLECKGYLCQCYITDDEGNVIVPATGRALRFDPNQPRDEQGQWTDTGKNISDLSREERSKAEIKAIESSKYFTVISEGYFIGYHWTSPEMADYIESDNQILGAPWNKNLGFTKPDYKNLKRDGEVFAFTTSDKSFGEDWGDDAVLFKINGHGFLVNHSQEGDQIIFEADNIDFERVQI